MGLNTRKTSRAFSAGADVQVLREQHAELLERLDGWLHRLNETLHARGRGALPHVPSWLVWVGWRPAHLEVKSTSADLQKKAGKR